MNIKGAFDYVSKHQLFRKMIELRISGDLDIWMSFFFIGWKVYVIINKYNNKESNVKTEIPQDFLVSPIFFLLYISNIFNKVSKKTPLITFLLLIYGLGFIVLGS